MTTLPTNPRCDRNVWVKAHDRRGVLLLVVLSMLTLFLMLGTAYLVVSTRSRETARAYARLAMQADDVRIPHAPLLDRAFLKFVRGGTTFTNSVVNQSSFPTLFESLLEDKYGSSVTGTATSVTLVTPNRLSLLKMKCPSVTGTAGLESIYDYVGRVVTLSGSGREPTSHRVIKAFNGNDDDDNGNAKITLILDNPTRVRMFVLPSDKNIPFVINGPEFSGTTNNEAWDGFDDNNCFLTHLAPTDKSHSSPGTDSVSSSQVIKIGFVPTSTGTSNTSNLAGTDATGFPFGADNDGDGVVDGYFFDVGLPTYYKANGDEIRLDVSALIIDLDSRFNVNAHGSLALNTYSTGSNNFHDNWARGIIASGSVPNLSNMPLGSGYGPPEINAGWMFPESNYSTPSLTRTNVFGSNPAAGEYPDIATLSGVQQSSQVGNRPSTTRFAAGTSTPLITNAEGRYGENSTGKVSSTASVSPLLTSKSNLIGSANYGLARPGAPTADDLLSQISDRGVNTTVSGSGNGGVPPEWWNGTTAYDWRVNSTSPGLPLPRGVYNSPPDLHGRMITTSSTTSTGAFPQLTYAKPEWGGKESTDDPYELRLDRGAPRNGILATSNSSIDNVFNVAELESVLRPYDRDSLQLPARLQAVLGSAVEEARLRVTTESWDTTALTGTAARSIRTWLKNAISGGSSLTGSTSLTGLVGGEIARGERFNLNRPFTADKPAAYSAADPYYIQRQAYFKDLFILLVALGRSPDATTAQWAANVVEFRDADSTMTPFEYDTNPTNGWGVDNNAMTNDGASRGIVWGSERPEVLITETSGWEENETTGELFIMLHRPWNAKAFASGTTWTHGEPVDIELDTVKSDPKPMNQLDLGRKSSDEIFASGTAAYPIWRLRLVDGTGNQCFVRFDMAGSGTASDFAPTTVTANTTPRMGCDSWLCIMGGNALSPAATVPTGDQVVLSGDSGRVVVTGSAAFRLPGPTPAFGTLLRSGTVYLERLTDPRAKLAKKVWDNDPADSDVARYSIVDQAPISVVNRRKNPLTNLPHPEAIPSVTRRKKLLIWKNEFEPPDTANYQLQPNNMMGGSAAMWFPWPNRPFISSAELLLVPGKDALGMLQSYVQPKTTQTLPALAATAIPDGLFDAVHVPTRFSGIHTTISNSGTAALATSVGIYPEVTPVNQISSFREPGRVNLNTVTSDDVWATVVAGPLQISGSAAPVTSRNTANFMLKPATGMHTLLALSGSMANSGATPPMQDIHPMLSPLQQLNPIHSIYTATRLANTATVRSNVFGVWITLRESVANDPDSIKLHRAFYIFDRSIPVGFEPGKDHNVWDAVLLRRIIE